MLVETLKLFEDERTWLGHFYAYDNRLELVCKNCYQKEQSMLGE